MAQYFDDIKVSDKGMIKLLRDEGKDFVFPACRIVELRPVTEKSELDLAGLIYEIFTKHVKEPKKTVGLKTKDGYMYINTPYTEELEKRIRVARMLSEKIEAKKYGTFM